MRGPSVWVLCLLLVSSAWGARGNHPTMEEAYRRSDIVLCLNSHSEEILKGAETPLAGPVSVRLKATVNFPDGSDNSKKEVIYQIGDEGVLIKPEVLPGTEEGLSDEKIIVFDLDEKQAQEVQASGDSPVFYLKKSSSSMYQVLRIGPNQSEVVECIVGEKTLDLQGTVNKYRRALGMLGIPKDDVYYNQLGLDLIHEVLGRWGSMPLDELGALLSKAGLSVEIHDGHLIVEFSVGATSMGGDNADIEFKNGKNIVTIYSLHRSEDRSEYLRQNGPRTVYGPAKKKK